MMVRASTVRDDVGFGLPPVISHSGLAGRLACLFAVAVLLCVSSAQGQVIEEGGFPVKGGGVSGESFSLSCPPRLVVQAGESVALSCSATDVPEEGVRYGWESVSGEGLRLLSDAQVLAPLFTASLSGAGKEYAYRLTAMAAGVYRTATVTVAVGGVPGETVGAPVVREECDSFTVPDELGEGCVEDKGPAPFGFGSEAEGGFLFPEAPGLPDRPSGPVRGGGSVMQAPPRLECPVAVFLEELEAGSIECRVFDASGEEYLEYVWEPVGSTTRDYLENPRLIPEDSPTPSVVAPEAPAYETLESFRSVETTFRYRYRLTATSRATGLSSFSEVEVFVSGSRPGVYCPLEVEVAEGESIVLDCEGVDPLSGRMDYDEDGASIEWEWEGLWGTSTSLLDATDRSSPMFTAPAGSAGEEYHYVASMTSSASGTPHTARRRVTVTVAGGEGTQASTDASALSRKGGAPVVTCEDSEAYEATADFTLACTVANPPSDATYEWTARGGTRNESLWIGDYTRYASPTSLLSATDIVSPTFDVPHNIPGRYNDDTYKEVFKYRLTMYSGNVGGDSADVHVTVLEKPNIRCLDGIYRVGLSGPIIRDGEAGGLVHVCLDRRGLADSPVGSDYSIEWTVGHNSTIGYRHTPETALSLLSATDVETPWFTVPDAHLVPCFRIPRIQTLPLPRHEYEGFFWCRYYYTRTVTAENMDPLVTGVGVIVLKRSTVTVVCREPEPVYEGAPDFGLSCEASGVSGGTYTWSWSPTTRLRYHDTSRPWFDVPDDVDEETDYEYRVTASAANAHAGSATVTVTVKDTGGLPPAVACSDPDPVYEGSEDITLDCTAPGAPAGSTYEYVWAPRGDTSGTSLLSRTDIASPVFYVPDEVDEDETYEYALTASARNAGSVTAEVTVTVLNRGSLRVACADPSPEVYEGSADVAFDCTASGAPSGSSYAYSWRARGATSGTSLLSRTDIASPVFYVPDEVDEDEIYEYLLTVSADNAGSATAEVTVTVLNRGALRVACADPGSVYEGSADVAFDCEASGAPSGSSYAYSWRARGATSGTSLLSRTDIASPVFYVPDEVDEDEIYEYLLTVSSANAEDASAEVTVTVLNRGALRVACADPGAAYEGSDDFSLDCEASGAPAGSDYSYAWTARGGTPDTDLLSATDGPAPTFAVPDDVSEDETYEYLLTVSAENAEDASAEVTVTVLNKESLALACADPGSVYEGSSDIAFDCSASGAPEGSDYAYAWTARGGTPDTDLLSATDGPAPTFAVPDDVSEDETYEYLLTVGAENAKDASAEVTVTVLNRGALALACADPGSVYEGSADFSFDCTASGAPEGSDYEYAWTARGGTADTDLLSATDGPAPTFAVPDEVSEDETYEYLLTVGAENAKDASAEVTVTVLNRGALALACADPGSVYEGSDDFSLDCEASGAPAGSDYSYAWTARGGTPDTDLLSGADGPAPTFAVPDEVSEDETYEYLLTVGAENAKDASAEVTVTVLNRGALRVACADPGAAYEGSDDFSLDCEASGAPAGSDYSYAWTARGGTEDTDLLSGADGPAPTFAVPDEVSEDETYEYLLTVSAANAEDASAEVTVTVLNKESLALACADPGSVYEGSDDFSLDCEASGAPAGSDYSYAWTVRGGTADTGLLSATDGPAPTFAIPDDVSEDETYEYLLTVSSANAEDASAEVTVTVLNKESLALACADPGAVYEGSSDIAFDCTASGAPEGSDYEYAWTARGGTPDTGLLSATDGPAPTFAVPDEVEEDETYEYLLTVSSANAEDASAEVTVTVLNKESLALACVDPGSAYEGSDDFSLDCEASGAPAGSDYSYAWTARGGTPDTDLLSATDGPAPTFAVPDEVSEDETYEYLLTVSAANAEDASAEVTVTVLNKESLALACADPGSVYEGSSDIAFDCTASGAPEGSDYEYAWTARGGTADTGLLSATDGPAPTFAVPDEVSEDETYEYLLTVSAANAEDAAAEVAVTVLDRAVAPPSDPVSPPLASSSARESAQPLSLGVTASTSPLRFGVQSADTEASLDPMTDQLSTRVSGPYHAGRMTLSPGGGGEVRENGEMALSIELTSPVALRRKGGVEAASIVLEPIWSFAESCEQLSSQAIGGLYTETTLADGDCRLLLFGGDMDLTDVPSGHYAGTMDVVLRSGESEETHSVEVDVTVVPAQRAITIGPGGVRFSTSREVPVALTQEQNLSIYPDVAFLTEGKPHGAFELSNPSLIPLEVTVSARFGYTEATENGREVVVEDTAESLLGDLSEVVDIHPGVLVLMPGEKGLVRYGVQEGALAAMEEKGYAAFFDVVSEPRQYVRTDRMPEEVTGDRTARVTMRVPGVYVPGEGASQLRATLVSISYVGSLSATFLVETEDRPFAGEVVAYDGDGRELGRRETLVYTRSRVRIPLDRMPGEDAVFLRFAPRGSGHVPEPASVEWNAPGRDIGAAGHGGRTTTPETLARKP